MLFAAVLFLWLGGCGRAGEEGPSVSPSPKQTKEAAAESKADASGPKPADKPLPTGLVNDPVYKEHDAGPGHPEAPERCDAVMKALKDAGLADKLLRIEPRAATDEELALCHTPDYIALVKREIRSGAGSLSTGDTSISAGTLKAALFAAGGVLAAVDAVVEGRAKNAFCPVRPPGHHASQARGMGFCVFNNIALAARYAQRKHKLARVLIVDWDVHHGNGTQDIFYEDGTVMYFSTHQHPWYPGTGWAEETGKGKGRGCIINCPFPAGAGKNLILGAYREKLLPAARTFRPDLVLISAGFDSREEDPLGRFVLTDDDYAEMTRTLMKLAEESAGGRVISVLEGGYNLEGLGSAAAAHVKALSAR
jgi:acetoin utilization deacetylase AcuC-like enzyme